MGRMKVHSGQCFRVARLVGLLYSSPTIGCRRPFPLNVGSATVPESSVGGFLPTRKIQSRRNLSIASLERSATPFRPVSLHVSSASRHSAPSGAEGPTIACPCGLKNLFTSCSPHRWPLSPRGLPLSVSSQTPQHAVRHRAMMKGPQRR